MTDDNKPPRKKTVDDFRFVLRVPRGLVTVLDRMVSDGNFFSRNQLMKNILIKAAIRYEENGDIPVLFKHKVYSDWFR